MRRLVISALALLIVLAACGQSQATPSHGLVLGAIYPLSGPQAAGGKEELAGVRAALAVAQSSGALKTPVQLDVVDATTPQAAAAAVDHLVRDDHVPAILGTYGSTLSAAALKVDVPVGDSINGGGVRFGAEGTLDQGQNTRAAAVVGQWQAVQDMRVVYPAAYATAKPILR